MTVDPGSRGWNEHRHRGIGGGDLAQPLTLTTPLLITPVLNGAVLNTPMLHTASLVGPLLGPISRSALDVTAVIEYATGTLLLPLPDAVPGSVRYYRASGGSLTLQNPNSAAYGLFLPGDAANKSAVTLAAEQSAILVSDGLNWWLMAREAPRLALRANPNTPVSWSTTAVTTWLETGIQSGNFDSLGGVIEVNVAGVFKHSVAGGLALFGLGIDGAVFMAPSAVSFAAAGYLTPISFTVLHQPAAGTHHYAIFAQNMTAGTLSTDGGPNALCAASEWLA
jgi:hypothetical protein